jgi:succinate dehydrogenase/fumarate reductase cytochrome b subunit
MKTILLIALAIIVLYFLFEIVVGIRVLLYVFRRKNDPVRSRLSRVLGEDA